MDTLSDRLSLIINKLKLTNQQLEIKAGLSNGVIGKAINGNKSIRVDSLDKILTACPEINPTWLITGKGNMFIDNSPSPVPVDKDKLTDLERIIKQQQETIDSQKEVIAMLKEQLALAKNTDTKTPAVYFSTKP